MVRIGSYRVRGTPVGASLGASRPRLAVFGVALLVATAWIGCKGDGASSASGAASASATVESAPMLPPPAPDKAAGCKAQDACKYHGQCTDEGDECVVGGEDDCRASLACQDWGTCGFKDDRCVAVSNEDCAASWNCRHKGRCRLEGGKCAVVKDKDCRSSSLCKYDRKCSARNGRCRR